MFRREIGGYVQQGIPIGDIMYEAKELSTYMCVPIPQKGKEKEKEKEKERRGKSK